MAFQEITGNGDGNGNGGDREFVSAKIGTTFEGVYQGMSNRLPSKFGGEYRIVNLDLTDGRKVAVSAGKILLERFEAAGLDEGDRVRLVVESAMSKAGREYALPRLYVDRSDVIADLPQTVLRTATPQVAKPAPVADDDEPSF